MRKILAGFLVFVFVMLVFPFVTVFGFYKTFLQEDFYRGELLTKVYNLWIDSVPDDVEWEEEFGAMDRDEFIKILNDTYRPHDLVSVVDDLKRQIADAEFPEDGILHLKISYDWMRSKADVLAKHIAEEVVSHLEPCESIEEFEISEHNCIPEGVLISTVRDGIKLDLERKILSDIPQNYDLELNLVGLNLNVGDNLSEYFMDLLHNVMFVGVILLVCLLLLIALLIFRPFSKIAKWEFRALFLASVLSLAAYSSLYFMSEKLALSESNVQFDLFALLVKFFSQNIIRILIPFVIVSLAAWVLFIVLDGKNES